MTVGESVGESVAAPSRVAGKSVSLATLADWAAPTTLAVVWVAFFIATPNFLTVANLSDLLVASAILAVLALGQQLASTCRSRRICRGRRRCWAGRPRRACRCHSPSPSLSPGRRRSVW
jgi:hypothetical protein